MRSEPLPIARRVRGSRALAAVGAFGLATLVLLTAIPSAGAAAPAGFRGAAWNPVLDKSVGGCARGHAALPHWTKSTGDGTWKASGSARTCPKSQGGSGSPSYADAEGELSIQAPVLLPTGSGGVNISWSLVIAAVTAGGITGSPYCPTQTTTTNVNYGFSWYNTSYTQADCQAMAEVFMIGSAVVIDQTTGVDYYPSNYWVEPYNTSGVITENYTIRETWSNASYWSYNATHKGNLTWSFGPSGNLTGNYDPQWFVNGTFTASHHYVVSTVIDLICNANVNGYGAGRASASVNADKGPHHWNLMPFSIW